MMFDNNSQCTGWMGGVPSGGMAQDSTSVYWADGMHVWSVSKSGGTASPITGNDNGAAQVAVFGSMVYWTNGGSVEGATTSGTGITTLSMGLNGSYGVAANGSYVYFGVQNGAAHVGRIPLSGGSDNAFAVSANQDSPNGMTLDGANIYWAGSDNIVGGIFKAPK